MTRIMISITFCVMCAMPSHAISDFDRHERNVRIAAIVFIASLSSGMVLMGAAALETQNGLCDGSERKFCCKSSAHHQSCVAVGNHVKTFDCEDWREGHRLHCTNITSTTGKTPIVLVSDRRLNRANLYGSVALNLLMFATSLALGVPAFAILTGGFSYVMYLETEKEYSQQYLLDSGKLTAKML